MFSVRSQAAIRSASCVAIAAAIASMPVVSSSAYAAGTTAGTEITVSITTQYSYDGTTYNPDAFTKKVKVGKLVTFTTTAEAVTTKTGINPGSLAVSKISLKNDSNDTISFGLTLTELATDTLIGTLKDTVNLGDFKMYLDSAGNGAGAYGVEDTLITAAGVRNVAADATVTIWVVNTIPAGTTAGSVVVKNNDVIGFELKAQAATIDGTTQALVPIAAKTATALDAGDAVVLGDAQGATDAARDGLMTVYDAFTVSAPVLSTAWYKKVIKDPTSGTTVPKAIPGATIQYCMAITNAVGSAKATDVKIAIPLPAADLDGTFPIKLDGTMTGTTCNAGTVLGTFDQSQTVPVIRGTIPVLDAGETRNMIFQTIMK